MTVFKITKDVKKLTNNLKINGKYFHLKLIKKHILPTFIQSVTLMKIKLERFKMMKSSSEKKRIRFKMVK